MSIERARRLRKNLTDAERRLWQSSAAGSSMDSVDGGQHAVEQAADAKRSAWLEGEGFRVVRFWNNDVLANADGVIEIILRALRG